MHYVQASTVLLIEDNPTCNSLLAEALEREGFAVVRANNVSCALQQCNVRDPDLVVLNPRPTDSVARDLTRLRAHPRLGLLPLIVIRRVKASTPPAREYAWLAGPVDVTVLLEHVWRIVNARVAMRAIA